MCACLPYSKRLSENCASERSITWDASAGVIARGTFRLILAGNAEAIKQRHSVSQLMAWPLLPAFVEQTEKAQIAEVRGGMQQWHLRRAQSLSSDTGAQGLMCHCVGYIQDSGVRWCNRILKTMPTLIHLKQTFCVCVCRIRQPSRRSPYSPSRRCISPRACPSMCTCSAFTTTGRA